MVGPQATIGGVGDAQRAGPNAVVQCKKLVRRVPTLSIEEGFEVTAEWSGRMFRSDEAAEGMAAFREKRKAGWIDEAG